MESGTISLYKFHVGGTRLQVSLRAGNSRSAVLRRAYRAGGSGTIRASGGGHHESSWGAKAATVGTGPAASCGLSGSKRRK